jgi:diguanylate cyclase (GGDEF)-like protein
MKGALDATPDASGKWLPARGGSMRATRLPASMRAAAIGLLGLIAIAATAQELPPVVVDGPPADRSDGADLLGLRQLGAAEGLPQLTVFALAQDDAGYIYAGTQDGLARWDGRHFTSVGLPGSRRDWVTHLWSGPQGLWIGTDEGGLQLLQGAMVRPVLDDRGQQLPSIEAISGARTGGVWVGTPFGLYRCDATACAQAPDSADLEVAELLETDDGALWVGTNVGGLFRFDIQPDGRLRRSDLHLTKALGLPNDAVRALAIDPLRRLWIGTGRGLARWDGRTLMRWQSGDRGPLGGVYGLGWLPDGTLLAALNGGGLGRFRMDDGFRIQGLVDGLPDSYLHALLVSGDADDPIVWLGSGSSGVLRLESGRWRTFDERHGLPQRVVVGVGEAEFVGGSRSMWVGTLGGAVRWSGAGWVPLLPPPFDKHVVYDVVHDRRGDFWYATSRGLLRDSAGNWREFTAERDGLPATSVEHMLIVDDRIWVGTGHGLATLEGDRVHNLLAESGPHADLGISAMVAVDVPGRGRRVLLGSSRGALLTDGRRVEALGPTCTPHGLIYDIEPLASGDLWLATRAGALRLRWRDGAADCTPVVEPGGAARTVYEIAIDPLGRIHLFGYDGVRRIDALSATGESNSAAYHRFGLDDGLPALEFNRDSFVDKRGRIWAANAGGLVMYDSTDSLDAPGQAPLLLDVRHDGASLANGARLSARHGELEFAPRLLSFRHEQRIRYRRQLRGLDPAPSAWLVDGDRHYPRLPTGTYRFEVEALDAAGRIHGPIRFDFSVAAPWWQHPLALLAGALALLAAGLGAGRFRARALAARAARLESLVAERTRELEHASSSDPLTGAWNRRYFHTHVHDWLRHSGDAAGLLLLLVDIDHFKQINDRHGHGAGDAVLVEIAGRLRRADGSGSELIRWGGEEFLLVLRRPDARPDADRVAAVLATMAAAPVAIGSVRLDVRCSIGYTRCMPSEGLAGPIDAVIGRADDALYRAKQQGRNRAVAATPAP